MCEQAQKIFAFLILKLLYSFNILLVPLIVCLIRNIYLFRSQITSACILYNKCSFVLLLMVWRYV